MGASAHLQLRAYVVVNVLVALVRQEPPHEAAGVGELLHFDGAPVRQRVVPVLGCLVNQDLPGGAAAVRRRGLEDEEGVDAVGHVLRVRGRVGCRERAVRRFLPLHSVGGRGGAWRGEGEGGSTGN